MTEYPDKRYFELAEKWLKGTISPAEMKEYADWYNTIDPEDTLDIPAGVAIDADEYRLQLLKKINVRRRAASDDHSVRHIHSWTRWRWAAAAFFLFAGTSAYLWTGRHPASPSVQATGSTHDVAPGGNKAILTLAGGQTIALDSAANGTLAQQGNSRVQKLAGGQLSYRATNARTSIQPSYNTLTTPRGGQYRLTLPDGTGIWLNAASSVTYPTAFIGNERKVTVKGEVYFEVAPDKDKPFKVFVDSAKGPEIDVLGTHFNINAYADETTIKTTLLEGSVKVSRAHQTALLTVGEQAQVSKDGAIRTTTSINTEEIMAWKNGLFQFDSADIQTVMRQLARWYDVQVSYEGNITPERFAGKLPRDAPASEVLSVLEKNQVHFRIEGKRIIVMP